MGEQHATVVTCCPQAGLQLHWDVTALDSLKRSTSQLLAMDVHLQHFRLML